MGDRKDAQPNGIKDKREDAPQNQAITISWQGSDAGDQRDSGDKV